MIIKSKLKFECQEDWNKMKIGMLSRHCISCKKDVVDFTKMNKEEILIHLLKNRNKEVCGRIQKSKLDYHQEEISVIINKQIRYYKKTNFAFYLLAISTLSLLSCEEKDLPQHSSRIENLPQKSIDYKVDQIFEINPTNSLNKDSILKNNNSVKNTTTIIDSNYTISLGDIDITELSEFIVGWMPTPPNAKKIDEGTFQNPKYIDFEEEYLDAVFLAEKMPEFKGGIDSLQAYLKREINYPNYEAENNIEGTVYISFIVNELGGITKSKIVRSVKNSQHFDNEVLRVIDKMPKWIPGENQGEKVNVVMHIPIIFKL